MLFVKWNSVFEYLDKVLKNNFCTDDYVRCATLGVNTYDLELDCKDDPENIYGINSVLIKNYIQDVNTISFYELELDVDTKFLYNNYCRCERVVCSDGTIYGYSSVKESVYEVKVRVTSSDYIPSKKGNDYMMLKNECYKLIDITTDLSSYTGKHVRGCDYKDVEKYLNAGLFKILHCFTAYIDMDMSYYEYKDGQKYHFDGDIIRKLYYNEYGLEPEDKILDLSIDLDSFSILSFSDFLESNKFSLSNDGLKRKLSLRHSENYNSDLFILAKTSLKPFFDEIDEIVIFDEKKINATCRRLSDEEIKELELDTVEE